MKGAGTPSADRRANAHFFLAHSARRRSGAMTHLFHERRFTKFPLRVRISPFKRFLAPTSLLTQCPLMMLVLRLRRGSTAVRVPHFGRNTCSHRPYTPAPHASGLRRPQTGSGGGGGGGLKITTPLRRMATEQKLRNSSREAVASAAASFSGCVLHLPPASPAWLICMTNWFIWLTGKQIRCADKFTSFSADRGEGTRRFV